MTYIIVLKVIKVREDRLNGFLDIWQKPPFCPSSPNPNSVKMFNIKLLVSMRRIMCGNREGASSTVHFFNFCDFLAIHYHKGRRISSDWLDEMKIILIYLPAYFP